MVKIKLFNKAGEPLKHRKPPIEMQKRLLTMIYSGEWELVDRKEKKQ